MNAGPVVATGPVATTGPVASTGLRVEIARVAGAPTSALVALACPAVQEGVERTLQADDALAAAVMDLLPALQAAVPALDRGPRAAALAVRRALHGDPLADLSAKNLRILDAAAQGPGDVEAPAPLATTWQRYRRALTERDAGRAALALAVEQELPAAIRSATRTLGSPDLLRGIAFASPAFAAALEAADADHLDCRPHKRHARSVTAYLTRAALKPSPFSTLGRLALVGQGPNVSALDDGVRSVFRPLLMSVLLGIAGDPRSWSAAGGPTDGSPVAAALTLRPLELLRPGTGGTRRPAVLVPQYCASSGVWYRHDEVTELDERWQDLRQRMSVGHHQDGGHEDGAPATPEQRAQAVRVGLVTPEIPWSRFSPTGFRELSDLLPPVDDGTDSASLLAARKQLRAAAEAEQRLLGATGAAQIAVAAGDIAAAAGGVLNELGVRRPAWWSAAPVAHESVAAAPVPAPSDRLRSVVEPLLRRSVRITPTYSRLVELSAQRYGSEPVDALTFCLDVAWAMESGVLRRPGATVPPGEVPRGHHSLAAPATAVFAQYLGDPAATATPVVVNKLTPAHPGVITRWAAVDALRDRVIAMADDWADRRHPGCRHYQFTAAGDWTTTQRPTLQHRPLVGWGADLADPDTIPLRDFTIRVDPATRTLQICDRDGHPAALGYVGAVPPYLLAGIPAVLALLADPWATRIPLPAVPAGIPGRPGTAARVGVDGVVLRRRTWWFHSVDVPDVAGASPTESLLAVERWRRRYELPAELFVAAVRADSPFGRADKPAWVSTRHPSTALTALRGPAQRWEITEALPTAATTDRVVEYCSVIEHG